MSDTRDKLVQAAKELFHQQGTHRTSIAQVAERAGIPTGNVYYHFRTRDSLVDAVAHAHADDIARALAHYERAPDPLARLQAMVRTGHQYRDELSTYGCPYAGLCQDMAKGDVVFDTRDRQLLGAYVAWTAEQFQLLGYDDATAADLAHDLIAGIQGAYLLTYTLHDPALLVRQLARLEHWLTHLAPPVPQ